MVLGMQPATDQTPRSGSDRDPCFLVLPSEDGGDWLVSFAPEIEKCIGRYARIPEFACNGHLLTILRRDVGLAA
jgi:hypothetical protein